MIHQAWSSMNHLCRRETSEFEKTTQKKKWFFRVYPLHTGPVQTAEMMYGSFLFLLFHVLFYTYISTCKSTYDHIRMQHIHIHTCDVWPCADSACFYSKVVFVRSCNLSKSWTKKTHRALVAIARHTSLRLNESLSKIHRSRVIASSMTRCFIILYIYIYLFGHVRFPGSFVVQPNSPWPGYHTCGHATIAGPTGSAYEDPSYLCLGRHFSSEVRKKLIQTFTILW